MDILYLCDGKDPECRCKLGCYLDSGRLYGDTIDECRYTTKIEHALNFKAIPGQKEGEIVYVELGKTDRIELVDQLCQ